MNKLKTRNWHPRFNDDGQVIV